MEMLRQYQRPLLWALLLHLALLALFFISFNSGEQSQGKPEEAQPETIKATMPTKARFSRS